MTDHIVVAGGGGVLGRAVVTELAERGRSVVVVDLVEASHPAGATITMSGVDLADQAAVEAAYRDIAGKCGDLAGLVNVAGGFLWETVENGDLESWDRMYRINLRTAAASCRAAIPHMRRGAAIVNIGAAAASSVGAGMAPYAASKAGVRALTEGLAAELKGRGIRVNAVLPTIIDTSANRRDMPDADVSTWVSPRAVARVVAFLLSPDAAAVTGASLPVSLGG